MIYKARTILPVGMEPILDGAILVEGERIADIDSFEILRKRCPDEKVFDLEEAVVIPGLVNLHSHIELESFSNLARPSNFIEWLRKIVKRSRQMGPDDWLQSARRGAARLISGGITATADISRWGVGALAMRESGLRGIAYHEIVGVTEANLEEAVKDLLVRFRAVKPSGLMKIGISPHSAYSLTKGALLRSVDIAKRMEAPLAIHVAETREEVEFLERGTGPLANEMRRLLGERVVEAAVCGKSPASYLKSLGVFGKNTIAVHCINVDNEDLENIRAAGSAIALCPTSNSLLRAGEPPILALVKAGVPRGLGTDSSSSNPQADLFQEMRLYREILKRQSRGALFPTAESLLEMATIGAATIMGLQKEIGSLEPGKMADFVVLDAAGRDEREAKRVAEWAARKDVIATVIGGRPIYCRGF